jgi:hypothetical protein
LFFVDVGKDQTMVDDVITSSSFLVIPIQDEKFEKSPIDMNVSQ